MSHQVSTLIVDDEPIFRNAFKSILERDGFTCRIAGTEDDAVRILERGFFPETAIVDYLIPPGRHAYLDGLSYGLSGGLRLAQHIQTATEGKCRIILLTGLNSYREAAQRAGVWGYCLKPIGNVDGFISVLRDGFLKDNERGIPTVDVNIEVTRRGFGKERFR